MYPELIRIPLIDWPIHGFGVMLVLGLLCAMELARWMARRADLNPDVFSNAALLALLTGVVGARLSHVLENLSVYTNPARSAWQNLLDAVNLASGGLTYYGGFLLAVPAVVIYLRAKRMPVWRCADIVAPCLMVGLAFGRVGCFLNGCCFGQTCTQPWAVTFPYGSIPMQSQFHEGRLPVPGELVVVDDAGRPRLLPANEALANPVTADIARQSRSLPVHPAQLYSAAVALLLAGLTFAHWTLTLPPAATPVDGGGGITFALMLALEGTSRFALELVRTEPAVALGMSLSMWLGLALAAVGVVLYLWRRPGTPPALSAPVPTT